MSHCRASCMRCDDNIRGDKLLSSKNKLMFSRNVCDFAPNLIALDIGYLKFRTSRLRKNFIQSNVPKLFNEVKIKKPREKLEKFCGFLSIKP